ncbi:MAG: pyruvate kinase [Methanomicrobiales archaeon]|jgi:pyruvate kinase|nr:pyruvate kinase [Methanomicrobiales archaeon]
MQPQKNIEHIRVSIPEYRHTKIVATLGPASADKKILREMMSAGMDIARLNLSHGSFEDHQQLVEMIREVSEEIRKHIAILADVPGQKIRITYLADTRVQFQSGDIITLTTVPPDGEPLTQTNSTASSHIIGIGPADYLADIYPNDTVILKDGAVTLSIQAVDEVGMQAVVTRGGVLTLGAGVIFPNKKRVIPFINHHFSTACLFAASLQPDYLALSFVESGEDIIAARTFLQDNHYNIPLIAKIESSTAVSHAEDIMAYVDGVMVARGDLGVAMPLEQIPHIQKQLIEKAVEREIPVITATEMLESMVQKNLPTRAEVTDVANAIIDGTDCVMLSAETSIGVDPVQAVHVMATISSETDKHIPLNRASAQKTGYKPVSALVSHAARLIADMAAVSIVAYTRSGTTARMISHERPSVPIFVITPDDDIARRVLLYRGVFPSTRRAVETYEELITSARDLMNRTGIGRKGDYVVILAGNTKGETGHTNTIKIEQL